MGDYAAQKLTYEQAAEELVADAWGGIFDSEESFRRWAQFQREQAEKNAGKAGTIHKVMQQVKTLLENILSKAKEVLRMDPENAAAQKARRLAEAEKRALQEEYFAHAEKAMDNLRSAKADENKNAAALKNESAAEKPGTRYAIRQDVNGESYIDTPKNISAATVARTAVLGLALTNQLLSAAGKPVLPIESTQVEQLVSAGFTIGAALASWWYNNSFTQAAIKADEEFERQKKRV